MQRNAMDRELRVGDKVVTRYGTGFVCRVDHGGLEVWVDVDGWGDLPVGFFDFDVWEVT